MLYWARHQFRNPAGITPYRLVYCQECVSEQKMPSSWAIHPSHNAARDFRLVVCPDLDLEQYIPYHNHTVANLTYSNFDSLNYLWDVVSK